MTNVRVGGIVPLTSIDYPGELAAVIFCQGCPWRCHYCHNRHLLSRSSPNATPWPTVMDFLYRRRGLLDAVVFSGGEPTMQRDLPDAVQEVRKLGYKVGLHTAGCFPSRLARVLPLIDWVALDIKCLPEDYQSLTGIHGSGEKAFGSLRNVIASGQPKEIRITVHNQLLPDNKLDRLIKRVRMSGVEKIVLQHCRTGDGASNSNEPDPVLHDHSDSCIWRN